MLRVRRSGEIRRTWGVAYAGSVSWLGKQRLALRTAQGTFRGRNMPRRPVWHHAASRAALAVILAFALLPGGSGVSRYGSLLGLAALQQAPNTAAPGTQAGNPACPGEEVSYNPGNGEDIAVPQGYKVQVFARDLNFPTGLAFVGKGKDFKALVIESGRGLPGQCNDPENPALGSLGGLFNTSNPFTPDLLVLNSQGAPMAGAPLQPTPAGGGLPPPRAA